MLTIVTAAHKNSGGLKALHTQIEPLLGDDIRWVIKDSGQCSETAAWSRTVAHRSIEVDASPDGGLYDALNCAVGRVKSEFYLVVGSDDTLDGDAVRKVTDLLHKEGSRFDIISFPVRIGSRLRHRKRYWPLFLSSSGLVTSHSVGTIMRTSLHDRFGAYDNRYRILADSLFLRKAHDGGARFEYREDPIMGDFGLGGVSSTDHGRRIVETYSYQIECGSSPVLQSILMMLRAARFKPRNLL